MSKQQEFRPKWASRPFDSVREAMEERGMSFADVRKALRISAPDLHDFFAAERAITWDMADRLTKVFGGSDADKRVEDL